MTHNDQINLQTTEGFFFIIVAVARILAFSSKRERGAASQHCWRNSFFEGYIRKPAIFFLNAGGGGEKKNPLQNRKWIIIWTNDPKMQL